MKIPTIEVTVPITADNLPRGPKWEEDGSCWEAIKCNQDTQGCEWRWQPKNWKAFAKDGPEGEMTDFVPRRLNDPPIVFGRAIMRRLVARASALTAIPEEELRGPYRPRDVCWTRFAIMAVAREHGRSLWQIDSFFNQCDHTSAKNGIRRAYEIETTNFEFANLLRLLREEVGR